MFDVKIEELYIENSHYYCCAQQSIYFVMELLEQKHPGPRASDKLK